MITRNGLNLFRTLLSKSKVNLSKITNIDGKANFVPETHIGTVSSFQNWDYNGIPNSVITASYKGTIDFYMPDYVYNSCSFNFDGNTGNFSTTQNYNLTSSKNYLPATVYTATLEPIGDTNVSSILATINVPNLNVFYNTNSTFTTYAESFQPIGIYGIRPTDTKYVEVTLPKRFGHTYNLDLSKGIGARVCDLFVNLGYSGDSESIDSYDLNSPVYDKRLCPTSMEYKAVDNKLIFTIAMRNYESESITVRELGLYIRGGHTYPVIENTMLSVEGYKIVQVSTYYAGQRPLMFDECAIGTNMPRPILIARKVLPQAVTIPPDGIATFKYTIDLSEMQAQENITYSEEE